MSQARSIKAKSVAMPLLTASAPDFGPFLASLTSTGTPESGSNGVASASQESNPGAVQIFGYGYANMGKSTAMNFGYGTAESAHTMSFTVPADTPFNFSTNFGNAVVNLTGPGVNIYHSSTGTTSDNGTFLAGQTYTVYADTTGAISAGNALGGSFAFVVSLNGTPPTPTSPHSSVTSFCPGQSVIVSVDPPPAGNVIDWYDGNNAFVGTGTSLAVFPVVNPDSTKAYFSARTRRLSDGAISFTLTSLSIPVKTAKVPSSTSANRDNLCQYDTGTVQLSASGGTGTGWEWFADSCGGTPIGTSSTIVIPSPSVTTTYYVRRVNDCVVSPCNSHTVTVWGCPGDFDCTGMVDDVDFVSFATAYDLLVCSDESMPAECPADLNGDGQVDDLDFVIFVGAYDNLLCPGQPG